MKKIPNYSYTDGVLTFGDLIGNYDSNNNALPTRDFNLVGKLCFKLETFREQDKTKFDSDNVTITLKISVKNNMILKSTHEILINEKYYSVVHIDLDNNGMKKYIYLTDLKDTLDKHITIYQKVQDTPFSKIDYKEQRVIWANVKKVSEIEENKADKFSFNLKYEVIVKNDDYFKNLEKNKLFKSVVIHIENKGFTINQIQYLEGVDERMKLYLEEV